MELYIHIPFCVRKCTYCAFDSFAGRPRNEMEQYLSYVLREASQRARMISVPIETIYIGGGTPSLIPPDLLEYFLASIREILDLSAVTEFSIEANPGTVSEDWLSTAFRYGANRISFGVQAVQNHLLETLGRIHQFSDAAKSVNLARKCGFRNINTDLIFGIPGQTMDFWQETLAKVISLSPTHISAYGLIPEEGTPLFRDLQSGLLSLPDPDLERDMYDTVITHLQSAGFQQYEISNFALPGSECLHNIGYWSQVPYIGLGLSAASMILSENKKLFSVRWTNPSVLDEYYALVDNPAQLAGIQEDIAPDEARFETIMLSLRMTKGMNRERFKALHGDFPEHWYKSVLFRLRSQDLLELENDNWKLTRRGMDIQNQVLLEFMD